MDVTGSYIHAIYGNSGASFNAVTNGRYCFYGYVAGGNGYDSYGVPVFTEYKFVVVDKTFSAGQTIMDYSIGGLSNSYVYKAVSGTVIAVN